MTSTKNRFRDCLSVLDPPLATAMVSPDSSMNSALVVTAGGGETSNGLQMFGSSGDSAGILRPVHPSAI